MNLREKRRKESSCLLRMEDGISFSVFERVREKKTEEVLRDRRREGGGGEITSLQAELRSADRDEMVSMGTVGRLDVRSGCPCE